MIEVKGKFNGGFFKHATYSSFLWMGLGFILIIVAFLSITHVSSQGKWNAMKLNLGEFLKHYQLKLSMDGFDMVL